MIRFNCPNCARHYELSPALAFLPLVCKQCGQRITPPAADPEPPAPAKATPKSVEQPAARAPAPPKAAAAPKPVTKAPPADDEDDGVLVTKADSTPDIDFNVGGPTAASLSDATRTRPSGLSDATRARPAELDAPPAGVDELQKINLDLLGPEPTRSSPKRAAPLPEPDAPPEARSEPTVLPFVADLIVFVLLVVVGMFLGELLTKKLTGQVLGESGSAAKFPPIDLLLWAAPPVMFALVYVLLGSRERTVGAWLRRRRAS